MHKEYVEFKKERDLGSIISDAFKFIRLEGKQFFLTILKIAAIPIVITVVTSVYMTYLLSEIPNNNPFDTLSFGGSGIIMGIAYLVTVVYVNLAGMYYIKSYIDNKGVVKKEEVIAGTKAKFWSFTGFGILAGLIIFASILLCFLPVIYTATVLSLGASILVFENEGATETISKSFNFISGYFWETFGVMFVVGLLVGVLGYVFQIPAVIYQLAKMGISMGNEDPTSMFNTYRDPIYLLLNVLATVGKFLFYSITLITNVLLYFDINERKNLTGTIERIDSIGQ
ncbi:hypothetical protein SAMN05444344_1746 [Tenacibaculum mesophilum]|uniref:Glycerophosphoryl diester phosphodiesterase membrane domain-containing protein n=1 Tax=Tenacibaculum mesophilum TaxID=104268 RepID=A0ABM7CDS3_9FLAO|nr:hypothetical protein [Tenacibaculum mesophilum]AZJ31908.1 hypothetical protein D6200_04725 [Tenacibaculum mesophilum]QFS27164.1 hypothetical protein F9Y86_01595 [Tenacibaculum mesophilum]SHF86167.1 hypothetical protein SAMN05444344_1746 [Tenacibaculum mesophilum]